MCPAAGSRAHRALCSDKSSALAQGSPRAGWDHALQTTSQGSAAVNAQSPRWTLRGQRALSQHWCHCKGLSSDTIPKKLRGNVKAAVKCNSLQR